MTIGTPLVGAMATDAATGPITPATPAGIAVGDVKHLWAYSYTAGNFGALSGWQLLGEVDHPTAGTAVLYRRVHQAGDANPSLSGFGNGIYGNITAYPGASTTTPEDVAVGAGNTGAGTTLTAPSATTATAGSMVAYYFAQGDNNTLGSPTGGATLTFGGASYSTTVGGDCCLAAAYETVAAPGASGTCAVTASGGQTNNQWVALTVAIRDAAATQSVTPAAVASAASVTSPTVDTTPQVTPVAVTSPATVAAPTVVPGTVFLTPAAVSSPAAVSAPTITLNAIPTAVTSPRSVAAPTVTRGERPPLRVDWWALDDDGSILCPLPQPVAWDLSLIPGEVGAVQIEYPVDGLNFAVLHERVNRERDLYVHIRTDGTLTNALGAILQSRDGDQVEESGTVRFTGSFLTVRLEEAPLPYNAANDKGETIFSAAKAGFVLDHVLDKAQAGGYLHDCWWTFTSTVDSRGVPWPSGGNVSANFSPGASVLEIAQQLRDWGLCEFEVTTDLEIRAYVPETVGIDHTLADPPIVLRRGRDLLSSPRRTDTRSAVTDILVAGKEGVYVTRSDATALARRGRRIGQYVSEGNLADVGSATAYGDVELARRVFGADEVTHELAFDQAHPTPLRELFPADWVYSDVGGGFTESDRERIAQLTVSQRSGADHLSGGVVLRDLIAEREVSLQRQLDRLRRGTGIVGTSQPPGVPDTLVPAAPTGVVADSLAYGEGIDTFSTVIVGWTAVTTNAPGPVTAKAVAAQLILQRMQSGLSIAEDWTWSGAPAVVGVWNDTLLGEFEDSGDPDEQTWLDEFVTANSETGTAADDIAGYRVEWRPQGDLTGGWRLGADTTATSTSFGGVAAGIDIAIRVFAYDRDGNVSAPSDEVVITTETDNTPPPVPSTPVVTPYLGQLKIAWDGLGSAGEAMPADLDFVEVHLSTAAVFTPSAATLIDNFSTIAGERIATDLDYGVTYYVRLVAVDRTTPVANRSEPSATGSGTPSKVVQIDIGPNAIGQQQIIDLEVITAKIDNLAVNDAKFGSGSFGKLTAGTISVAVTNAGIIRSGTSGQRYELDAAALRFYNSAGTQTIGLTGAPGTNFITGELRTAMTGARLRINPGGTLPDRIDFHDDAGNNNVAYLYTYTVSGQAVLVGRGNSTRGDGKAGEFGAWPQEGYVRWVAAGSVTPNSSATARNTEMIVEGPTVKFQVRRQFGDDGAGHRHEFLHRNSSGNVINATVLNLQSASGDEPWFAAVYLNSGLAFGSNTTNALNSGGSFGPVGASAFNVSSSVAVKDLIGDIDLGCSARDVLVDVPSFVWKYKTDLEQERDGVRLPDGSVLPFRAPWHIGPMAEDLPEVMTHVDDAGNLMVNIDNKAGFLWQVCREQEAELRALRRDLTALFAGAEPTVVDGDVTGGAS